MKKWIIKISMSAWTHRAGYAGLALTYGCGCIGIIDKELVAQIATLLYAIMSAQRH